MANDPPYPLTLDYAAAKPRSRLRKWSRRIVLAVLVLACLYATPVAWLYWGWKQEQPAREMVARVGGRSRTRKRLAPPSWCDFSPRVWLGFGSGSWESG